MKNKESKVFDLQEVQYTDLEGATHTIPFDQKDFANALFNGAKSIDMDDFAREIHRGGKAPMNEQVSAELLDLAPQLWVYRAASAVKELVNKLNS